MQWAGPVSFPALHTFVGVVAPNAGGLLDGLHTLAVHDGGTGMGIFAYPATLSFVRRSPEPCPQAGATELLEVIVHRLPWRKTAWQIAPRAAGPQQIEQGVEHGSQRVAAQTAMRRARREESLQAVPLRISKAAWIAGTHTAQTSSCPSRLHYQTRAKSLFCHVGRAKRKVLTREASAAKPDWSASAWECGMSGSQATKRHEQR
jgi:hypothetical protein